MLRRHNPISSLLCKRSLFLTQKLQFPSNQVYVSRPAFEPKIYLDLTKSKLTMFVLLTTMAGYTIAPGLNTLSVLFMTTAGTGLQIACANSMNQVVERHYDAQMSRTRNRVMVRHAISLHHAFLFGMGSGLAGTMILWTVNPYCALIGFSNIILYTCVYTPLKRVSIYNTWPGALVGALPPMMGWIASTGTIDMGAILLGLSLFSWQFPHFNALSWNLRPDYARAGYR